MNAERIAELRELCGGSLPMLISEEQDFVIDAHAAIPELLDEVERLMDEVNHLRTVEHLNCRYKDQEYCTMEDV